jgi:signal transduction histidine kinase
LAKGSTLESTSMHDIHLDFQSIAHDWYIALLPTSFTPAKSSDVIDRLASLVQVATRLCFAEEYQSKEGRKIGTVLADLNFIQGDAIGLSMKLLSKAWMDNIPALRREETQGRSAILFGDMANGYFEAATRAILNQQEMMREAQLSMVRALHADLEKQRDNLHLSAERLQILHKIESGILAAQSAEAIADVAITQIMRIIPYSLAIVVTIDLRRNAFVVLASKYTPDQTGDLLPLTLTTEERLRVLENKKSLIVNNIGALKNQPPGLQNIFFRGIKSVMTVPLVRTKKLIGILSLGSTEVNFFTDQHDEIVRQIADSVAVAPHNRQLFETEQRARRESETLREVAANLSSNLELEELLDNILVQMENLLAYDGAIILLRTDNKPQVVAQRGFLAETTEKINQLDQLPPNMQRLMSTQKPVYIPDTELDAEWIKLSGASRVRCWLGAPLIYQKELIGLLAIDKHEPNYYLPSAQDLVLTFANQAAVAIENARLFNKVQQSSETLRDRIAARTQDLESLYEIAAITSQPLELSVILNTGLDRVLNDLDCQSGAIHILDKESGNFNLAESINLDPSYEDQIQRIKPDNASLNQLFGNQKPLTVMDTRSDPKLEERLFPANGPCFIVAPMQARGEIFGILSLYCEQDHDFTDDEIKLAASIANHMGVAIDNAILQEQSEKAAVIEERERLARELHDSATQSLFSLTLFAAAAREKVRSGQLDTALQHLSDIGFTANQTHRDMRLLLYQLGSSQLLEEGLVETLERRLRAVEERSGIVVTFLPKNITDLTAEVEQALFQIANEALNNALKHAAGTSVTVELLEDDSHVMLIILDDGNGFDPAKAIEGAGMGLKNMQLRSSRMGGELLINSSFGIGSEIVVRIPKNRNNHQLK